MGNIREVRRPRRRAARSRRRKVGPSMATSDPRGEDRPDLQIKIGGPAGFGIKAAGQTLARSFVHAGLNTFDLTEYPSLIKGGHNAYQVRVSPESEVLSQVEPVDILPWTARPPSGTSPSWWK